MPSSAAAFARDLSDLHDAYIFKVNAALADGRSELVTELGADFVDEAQRTIVAAEPRHGAGATES